MKSRITTTILITAVAVFVAAQIILSSVLVLRNARDQETDQLYIDLERSYNALSHALDRLEMIATDWSNWDETYHYAAGAPDTYYHRLYAGTLERIDLNLIVITDVRGTILTGVVHRTDAPNLEPLSAEIGTHVGRGRMLVHPDTLEGVSGFLLDGDTPIMVASRPILRDTGAGPYRGTLIAGRYLTAALLRNISDSVYLPIRMARVDESALAGEQLERRTIRGETLFMRLGPEQPDRRSGQVLVPDLTGRPILALTVETPRTSYRQTVRMLFHYVFFTVVLGGTCILIVLYLNRRLSSSVQETQESDRRFRLFFNTSPEGVAMSDGEGRILEANPALCRMLGYAAEELMQKPWIDLVPPDDRPLADNTLRGMNNATPPHAETTYRLIRKDRTLLWIEATAVALGDGRDTGHHVIIARNITEHRKSEENLRRMAMAVEQAEESIVITDPAGVIEYVNPAFTRITGYTPSEAIGRTPRILKSGKHDDDHYRRMWRALTHGETWTGRFSNRRKDGSLYDAYQIISPLRNATDDIINYVSVSRDISRELELESQFLQAQKMESIGRLAGGIAHDFNNLLTVILGNSRMMLDDGDGALPYKQEVQEIIQAGERAARLTRQLLMFARKQIMQLRPVDLNEVVRDISVMLRRMIGETVEIRMELGTDTGCIEADPSQIEQVVVNLAVNARDAMPDGGVLTLATRNVRLDESFCRRHMNAPVGDYVLLSVRDSGCGIPGDVRPHIFDPFFTTKGADKGTGLGLATVYGAVQQCKGLIEFDSIVGQGTEFRLYFPECADRHVVPEESGDSAASGGNECILVVEDETHVRTLTARILEALGYRVLAARHGQEGLDIFRKNQRDIDLIITDIVMPNLTGPEMLELARAIRPDIPFIYISGFTDRTLVQHGVLDEEVPILLKPFTRDELAARIRALLDHLSDPKPA